MAEFEKCRDPNCSWAKTAGPRVPNPHCHPVTPGRRGSLGDVGQFQPRLVPTRERGVVTFTANTMVPKGSEFAVVHHILHNIGPVIEEMLGTAKIVTTVGKMH